MSIRDSLPMIRLTRVLLFSAFSGLLVVPNDAQAQEASLNLPMMKAIQWTVPVFNSSFTEKSFPTLSTDWDDFRSAEHFVGERGNKKGVFILGRDQGIFLPFKTKPNFEELRYIETFEELVQPGFATDQTADIDVDGKTKEVTLVTPAIGRTVQHKGRVLIDRWQIKGPSNGSLFVSVVRLVEQDRPEILGRDPNAEFTLVRLTLTDPNRDIYRRDADVEFIASQTVRFADVVVGNDELSSRVDERTTSFLNRCEKDILHSVTTLDAPVDSREAVSRKVFYARRNFLIRRVYSRDLAIATFDESPGNHVVSSLRLISKLSELRGDEDQAKLASTLSDNIKSQLELRETVYRSLNLFFEELEKEGEAANLRGEDWSPSKSAALQRFFSSDLKNPLIEYGASGQAR